MAPRRTAVRLPAGQLGDCSASTSAATCGCTPSPSRRTSTAHAVEAVKPARPRRPGPRARRRLQRRWTMPNGKGRRGGSARCGGCPRAGAGPYPGPDGMGRSADDAFVAKIGAEVWLASRKPRSSGDWVDPDAGRSRSRTTARPGSGASRPATQDGPALLVPAALRTSRPLSDHDSRRIDGPAVRRWRRLLDNGVGPVTVAKAYRLLKAVLDTAVDDGLIRRNPCRIKGAGNEHSPERPMLTVRRLRARRCIDPRTTR